MMVHGEACYDTWALDPRRFTRYANVEYTALKAVEDYQNEFRFHMPHEHRPAGRPMKTTPLTATLEEMGAAFGVVNGWERVLYFKTDPDFEERHSFRFDNTFELVAAEVEAVRSGVGIMEVSGFNRFEITGKGVRDWLDGIVCSRVPAKVGRVALTYFLNELGNVKGEATLANLAPDRVWYGSAAAAEYHDMDWLRERLPADGSIELRSLTDDYTILVVAGPRARDVLAKAAPRTNWSNNAFPWLSVQRVFIGNAEAIAMSVSFSGELAWELHVPNAQLALAFRHLWEAGQAFGIKPFGLHATESMRLEKGFRHWKADLITEYNPFESGLERFVKMDKDFVGKAALERLADQGPRRRFVTMVLGGEAAPAQPGDSILANGGVVGTVTSAGWGHRVGKNIAMGFVDPPYAEPDARLAVEVVGEPMPALVSAPCLYDPAFALVRS